jgi:hypothetical protein
MPKLSRCRCANAEVLFRGAEARYGLGRRQYLAAAERAELPSSGTLAAMNRRRLLAWLGLAPIAAVPAVKAIASDTRDEAFLRLAKEVYVCDDGFTDITPLVARSRPSSDRRFPIRRAGGRPATRFSTANAGSIGLVSRPIKAMCETRHARM